MTSDERPWPPGDVAARPARVRTVAVGTELHRFYTSAYDPIFFDTSKLGRLNAPDESYGVLYTAEEARGAFAEAFLRSPARALLAEDFIRRKAHVTLRCTRELKLVQLHGPGLKPLGATAEVTSGGLPYDLPQAWSAALYGHPDSFDGVAYRARHDNDEICFAIFSRAAAAITEQSREVGLLDQDWFYDLMSAYEVGLEPS